jgi:type IV pilus assembly protein PilA
MNDIRKNASKGFSLVELIVVIAIMAVMVAVLAPSLLAYVERSRAQKDDSAMGEVTNAILLGLSDQDIYDEVLFFTAYGNVSCYIDEATEGALGEDAENIETKAGATGEQTGWKRQYTFDDDARLNDEVPYYAAGNMRGVTITFQPEKNSNSSKFVIGDAIINKFLQEDTDVNAKLEDETQLVAADRVADEVTYINDSPVYADHGTFDTMASGSSSNTYLYNRTRATIKDKIDLTSQTYRNSEYTVFIRMGSTGGNQADAQDAIVVYGQWNGTNLPQNATSIN